MRCADLSSPGMLAHTFILRSKWEWRRCARGRLNQPKCPEVSSSVARRKGGEKQSEMRGTPRGGERNNETSRLAFETGEKKSETCVWQMEEKHGVMWLLGTSVALELPLFLLFSLCTRLYFFPGRRSLLYFRFSIHDTSPRREPADANDEARFDNLPRTFSFRTEVSIFKRYPIERGSPPEERVNPSENENRESFCVVL